MLTAKIYKNVVEFLSWCGLTKVWARNTVKLEIGSYLTKYFPNVKNHHYAFFTGTDSPHRKMTTQVMDAMGRIYGYAKYSSNPAVSSMLKHEAMMLDYLNNSAIKTASFPNLIFCGNHNNGTILVTDTSFDASTKSVVVLSNLHVDFLNDMASCTKMPSISVSEIIYNIVLRVELIKRSITKEWQNLLNNAIEIISNKGSELVFCCLSHGDFTPWNTYIVKGKLYVFDWEYAEMTAPASNDLIHFVINQPNVRNRSAKYKLHIISKALASHMPNIKREVHVTLIGLYLLSQILRQVERLHYEGQVIYHWDGMVQQRELMDVLIETMKK